MTRGFVTRRRFQREVALRKEYEAQLARVESALAHAMVALQRHDDWCGYNRDAPGDPSFNRAWRSYESLGKSVYVRAPSGQAESA